MKAKEKTKTEQKVRRVMPKWKTKKNQQLKVNRLTSQQTSKWMVVQMKQVTKLTIKSEVNASKF